MFLKSCYCFTINQWYW